MCVCVCVCVCVCFLPSVLSPVTVFFARRYAVFVEEMVETLKAHAGAVEGEMNWTLTKTDAKVECWTQKNVGVASAKGRGRIPFPVKHVFDLLIDLQKKTLYDPQVRYTYYYTPATRYTAPPPYYADIR